VVYFAAGLVGQTANYLWDSGAGLVDGHFRRHVGASIASMLPLSGMLFRSKQTDAFADPRTVVDDRDACHAGV
jgi:hypothetical protein